MQSYIDAMNSTTTIPAGRERNEMRNTIMAAMLAIKPSDRLFPTTDIGSILANVYIVYTSNGPVPIPSIYPLMRSSCLGALLANKTRQEIIKVTRTMAAITHISPASIDGSIAIALAANYAVATRHVPLNAQHFIEYIASAHAYESPDFAKYIYEQLLTMGKKAYKYVQEDKVTVSV